MLAYGDLFDEHGRTRIGIAQLVARRSFPMSRKLKNVAFAVAAVAVGLVAGIALLFIGLKLLDYARGPAASGPGLILPGAGSWAWTPTRESTELYPYTGWHTLSDLDWSGEIFGKPGHVVSGSHGFYIDFDLDHPPPKQPNEVRIILTGGSAAQGFHGTSNDKMFYRILEARLNETFGPAIRIRIINLAMASTMTYQNFIALNRWGHALDPDLILSYSGRNDMLFPNTPTDLFAPYKFETERGLSDIARLDLSPRWLKRAHDLFPNVITGMDYFSMIVRLLNIGTTTERDMERYNASYRAGPSPDVHQIIIKQYVDALKSIKRDFQGIPMLIVFQPTWTYYGDFYPVFRAETIRELSGYVNDDWYFYDLQAVVQKGWLFDKIFVPHDDCHASDAGHVIISDFMEPELTKVVRMLIERRSQKHAAAARGNAR